MHSWFLVFFLAAYARVFAAFKRSISLWGIIGVPFHNTGMALANIYIGRSLLPLNVLFYEPRWHLQRIEEHIRKQVMAAHDRVDYFPTTIHSTDWSFFSQFCRPRSPHPHTHTHRHQHLLRHACFTASRRDLIRSIRHRHLTAIHRLSVKPELVLLHRFVLQHPETYFGRDSRLQQMMGGILFCVLVDDERAGGRR